MRQCGSCGVENPPTARFCMGCGSALERRCPACGEEAPAQARFCMTCGAALDGRAEETAPPAVAPAAPRPAEERRTVTILFADLSGYTEVSERLDPEAVSEVADRSLRRLAQEVERFGGTVDKYIGDNIMAIFGAPTAHEDDPERAVRAGFGMLAAMDEINADVGLRHGARFELRVGINTGEVLAGEVAGAYTVMGDAVNVAARLQTAGRPGSVTVGEQTWRATRHRVEYVPLEPLTLKGKSEPVPAWEGARLLAEHRGGPATRPAGSKLVGRVEELALVESAYRRVVAESRAHLVTIVGEAGVGKSRLLRELDARLEGSDPAPTLREGRCLPYGSGTVYWALGEVLREECGIADEDSAETARDKLASRVRELLGGDADEQTVALLGSVLGMEDTLDLDPQRRREAFQAAARALVEEMAARRPLVLAFEDIHWADNGMLDLVEHIAQWARGPVLIVALARDELLERRAGWGSGRRTTNVTLHPLTVAETSDLVGQLLGGVADAQMIAERSGGNPFFAEELARRVTEEQESSVADLPATVQGLLAARLDGLPPVERRILQQAAVIGRTFWASALAPVADAEDADLQRALDSLADRELIVPGEGRRLAGEPELAFKHVLIRDVAYGMLPRAARARKHFEVGSFVERSAGDRADEVAPLLAEHYGRAAALGAEAQLDDEELAPMRDAALRYVEAAGDAAARLFANEEAFEHYAGAMALLDDQPGARAAIADKQGDVALRLGRVDEALAAWRACLEHYQAESDLPRVGGTLRKIGAALAQQGERRAAIEHYQQGMNLLKEGPPSRELVRLYEDAAWLYVQSGDNMLAIYASEKALRLARELGEAAAVSRAHGIFGRVFSRIGDAARARENLEKAVELARGGSDPLEEILALLALGNHLEVAEADYGAASDTYTRALEVAERIGDVPSQVELHAALAQLAVYRADWDAVRALSADAGSLAKRAGLVLKLCLPRALEGLLAWREGRWAEAERSYRSAAELAAEVGWSEVQFAALQGLAAVQRDHDDAAAALGSLDAALEVAERAGLTVQSIQARAAKAVLLAVVGRRAEAEAVAAEATEMSGRLRSPVGEVAALEGQGACDSAAESLRKARDGWEALGRPLDAARCELLTATVTGDRAACEAAAEAFERLGVDHLAGRARELALR